MKPSAISHFENGTRKPSFDNLRRLAEALRVSVDYLLGRTENPVETASEAELLYRDFQALDDEGQQMIQTLIKRLKGDG